jgi:hypothetical protein
MIYDLLLLPNFSPRREFRRGGLGKKGIERPAPGRRCLGDSVGRRDETIIYLLMPNFSPRREFRRGGLGTKCEYLCCGGAHNGTLKGAAELLSGKRPGADSSSPQDRLLEGEERGVGVGESYIIPLCMYM